MRRYRISKHDTSSKRPSHALLTPTRAAFIQEHFKLSPSTITSSEADSRTSRSILADAFQTLLERWNIPAETAYSFLKHPNYEEWERRSSNQNSPIIFQLIEDLVPEEGRFDLMRKCLEEDLAAHHLPSYPFSKWRESWEKLLNCEEWLEAKDLVLQKQYESQIALAAGETFVSVALVVIAEQLLLVCKDMIDQSQNFERPLTPCDENDDNFSLIYKRKYIEILKDFHHTQWTVSLFFYKFALEVMDTQFEEEIPPRQESIPENHPQEYSEYESRPSSEPCFEYKRESSLGSSNEDIIKGTSSLDGGSNISLPTAPINHASNSPPTSTNALSTLVSKRENQCFNSYAISLLSFDGQTLSIFKSYESVTQNIFSLLATDYPQAQNLPITTALLECFTSLPRHKITSWSLGWVRSLLHSSSWTVFISKLENVESGKQLELVMGTAGRKLIEDAIVLMVGKRLLHILKETPRKKTNDVKIAKKKSKEGYIAILRVINQRGLKVDLRWYSHLYSLW